MNDLLLMFRNYFLGLDEDFSSLSLPKFEIFLSNEFDAFVSKSNIGVSQKQKKDIVSYIFNEVKGYGPLESLINDETISDILVNGKDTVFVERSGVLEKDTANFIDEEQLVNLAKRVANSVGRTVDSNSPLCDARLADGSRINIVIPPIAIDGTSLSIRKFRKDKLKLEDLICYSSLTEEMGTFLACAVQAGCNIIISGGTGSGKTTLLNGLCNFVLPAERIVTIEDAAELQLQHGHVVRLETKNSINEHTKSVITRDLVINALRMRPNRIIVGECRGSEAFEMLQAMNTGHDGSMTTIHANTPIEALNRIENMVLMASGNLSSENIKTMISSSVNIIVQTLRFPNGKRIITHITEVLGVESGNITTSNIASYHEGKFIFNSVPPTSFVYEKIKNANLLAYI